MLGIGLHRLGWIEIFLAERVGQLLAPRQVVEMDAIGQQVEDKDLHGVSWIFVEYCRLRRTLAHPCAQDEGTPVMLRMRAANTVAVYPGVARVGGTVVARSLWHGALAAVLGLNCISIAGAQQAPSPSLQAFRDV